MILTSYTVKKGYIQRVTTKTASGGYDSSENNAEITATFTNEGAPIDEKECNEKVRKLAQDLLDDDPEWLKHPETEQEKTK